MRNQCPHYRASQNDAASKQRAAIDQSVSGNGLKILTASVTIAGVGHFEPPVV